ncbi:hypothetical protein [Streptomyces cinereoruber]|uniref:hypothetical protein n=1 Tax=Streptomyces cinereoruber TaxID=67260 RepID=UPI00362B5EE6
MRSIRNTMPGALADDDAHRSPSSPGSSPSLICVTTESFAYTARSHASGVSARSQGFKASPR